MLGMGKHPMWLECCLVKGRTNKVGEVGWGQTMKGSECLLKLYSRDHGIYIPRSLSGGEAAPSETVCDGSGVRVNAGRPGRGVKKAAVVFGSGWQR